MDAEFRRAGIATQVVRFLFQEISPSFPGKRNLGRGGENTLTEKGMGLTLHCQEIGFVLPFPDDE